jgi:hypothetical protein
MVKQGIVLGHVISHQGIEVDKAKVGPDFQPSTPTYSKGNPLFLGPCRFLQEIYPRF